MPEPVLIVGAGPTGLTAALELSRLGIPVRLIEKRQQPAETSRAIGVQARTLELFAQRGLANELIGRGNQARGGSVYGGGKRIVHLDLTQIPSRYNFILLVSQVETERVLRDAVERQGVTVEWGVELVGIAQDPLSTQPRPVQAVVRHADGRLETTDAAYLISAEGAHSRVRTTLDLGFKGETFVEEYALGDLHLDGDLTSSEVHIFSSTAGFLALFPLGDRHFRLICGDAPGDPKRGTPPTLDELQTMYDGRSHIPAKLRDLTWSSWFQINSRIVEHLQHGRFLLGGDSAHIHSPAGGQGMNTGIQDMINLGWKLALVLKGYADPSLLATYEQDRLPVMRAVLSNTERLTHLIGSENPVVRGVFNQIAPWVGNTEVVQEHAAAGMSQVAIDYRVSPLSKQWTSGAHLHAGDRVPDLAVRVLGDDGQTWHDTAIHSQLDPSRFVLLIVQAEEPTALRAAVAPWTELIDAVEIVPPTDHQLAVPFQHAFGTHSGAFLVRPDGYLGLAATGPKAAHHLVKYCQEWLAEPTSNPLSQPLEAESGRK